MKKFFISFAMLFYVIVTILSLSSTVTPAADSVPLPKVKNIATKQTNSDEDWSTLFCTQKQDTEAVRTAYESGGDSLARQVANTFVMENSCSYRQTVFTATGPIASCKKLANSYCIAIQPSFTCTNDEPNCYESDGIKGFNLEESKVAHGEIVPPDTEAMLPVRTIIVNNNK